MGNICASASAQEKDERLRSRVIEKQGNKDKRKDASIKKLLLLGAGESGKSTLFKQCITLYGSGFTEEERQSYRDIVFNNTISSMRVLIKHTQILATRYNDDAFRISDALESSAFRITAPELKIVVDQDIADKLANLWADPGIQKTFQKSADYQLLDSAGYFLDRIRVVGQPTYCPTEQDVLRTRVRTTGIVETCFQIDNAQFRMFDVGGQRNERKKWIHCFEEVTAVIFVVAVSAYDQTLYEDETTNRLDESMVLFDEMCNSRWFQDTPFILFLNKRDIFEKKIKKIQIRCCFSDYQGPDGDKDAALDFIQAKFESANRTRNQVNKIYTHVTCATDANNVKFVFDAVKDTIIRQALRDAGLMCDDVDMGP